MSVTDCDFLEQIGKGKWRTTRKLEFKTRFGEVDIPEGFETDLFTLVADTQYPDFWKAACLHDYLCWLLKQKEIACPIRFRLQADIAFRDEMLIQSAIIFGKLQEAVGTEHAVDEFQKLLKTTKLYYNGVSGIFGRVYQFFAD
jgi:hypothetical protein